MNKENVLVVIPAFNEEANISHVLTQVLNAGWPVVVINDGSSDNTVGVCRGMGVKVLDLPINLGVGGALRAGFKYAVENNFDAVVQIDADGQHPVDAIGSLVNCAQDEDAHLVIGSRFLSDSTTMTVSKNRKIAMWVLATTASKATNCKITDATSGFRVITQPLLSEFSANFASNYLGDTYEAIIAAGRAGYRVREIPAPLGPRLMGESTASTSQAFLLTLKCGIVYLFHFHLRIGKYNGLNRQQESDQRGDF
jgi:glycosyltransferase involved in cell wall biosynthesis